MPRTTSPTRTTRPVLAPVDPGGPDAVQAVAWLPRALAGAAAGTAASCVPTVLDGADGPVAVVRLLHPASDADGRPARWEDVARATGADAGPLASWDDVATSVRDGRARPGWDGEEPDPGDLDGDDLAALLEVLAGRTAGGAGAPCWALLWEGWGAVAGAPPARVVHAGREHVLAAGPLAGAAGLAVELGRGWSCPRSPTLLWPADRSWCVATDPAADSTLVAGAEELAADLLGHPGLEARRVAATDRVPGLPCHPDA